MSAAIPQDSQHLLYQQYIDLSNEIQNARDEIYDACEKLHLILEDINPSFQKDNAMAIESYNYAKKNYQTPYYKEILRVMGNFQKRINNTKIKLQYLARNPKQNECCSICTRNIQISQILLNEYFKQESTFKNPTLASISTFSSMNDSLSQSSQGSIQSN